MTEEMFPLRLTIIQRRFLMVVTSLCLAWALGFKFLTSDTTPPPKPRYAGTTGPYLVAADGRIEKETDTYRPGDRLGWLVAICYEPGTAGEAVTDLVDAKTGDTISTTVTPLPISEVPCATKNMVPKLVIRAVPLDIAPGRYELRRRLILGTGETRSTIRILSPFIAFKVGP